VDDLDEVVIDPGVAEGRAPTKPLRHGSIEIDFADGNAAAEFLELMAKLIRTRGKVRIVLE
jgi:hypothetical protein